MEKSTWTPKTMGDRPGHQKLLGDGPGHRKL